MEIGKDEIILGAARLAYRANPPRTQYEAVLIAARICVAIGDVPKTDSEFLSAAEGGARAFFGAGFAAGGYPERVAYIDMYERALREAANAPMRD
jgi:hypothetical protein